jgi:hypothetical protein
LSHNFLCFSWISANVFSRVHAPYIERKKLSCLTTFFVFSWISANVLWGVQAPYIERKKSQTFLLQVGLQRSSSVLSLVSHNICTRKKIIRFSIILWDIYIDLSKVYRSRLAFLSTHILSINRASILNHLIVFSYKLYNISQQVYIIWSIIKACALFRSIMGRTR